jgi:hypothetical protein
MIFECIKQTGKRKEKWSGRITYIRNYGCHFELNIVSRSSLMVLFGKTSRGFFASIPDLGSGCHLVNPSDIFWNTESLSRVLGKVDGITVAAALYTVADKLKVLENSRTTNLA